MYSSLADSSHGVRWTETFSYCSDVFKGENETVCDKSYIVSYHVAYCSEAYVSAEYLIIPYAQDKILVILQGYQKVPLSNSSVVRGIKDINYNIKYELKWLQIIRVLLGNLMNSHSLISHYKIEKSINTW
jgi:hypothetical protein